MGNVNPWVAYYAAQDGVPVWIANDIVQVESGGDPNAKGDYVNGSPTSFGSYQLHQNGGQGTGYTAAQLLNPKFNAKLGTAALVKATQQAQQNGLTGLQELMYVANNSGHPGNLGVATTQAVEPSYDTKLAQVYKDNGGQTGAGGLLSNLTPQKTIDIVIVGLAAIMLIKAL